VLPLKVSFLYDVKGLFWKIFTFTTILDSPESKLYVLFLMHITYGARRKDLYPQATDGKYYGILIHVRPMSDN
jgi:hypothetical protein